MEKTQMAVEIYGENKAKGFWKEREKSLNLAASQNDKELSDFVVSAVIAQCVSLINSELFEAKYARDKKDSSCKPGALAKVLAIPANGQQMYKLAFELEVKDTFQDEIADAVIRCYDLCGGFYRDVETEGILIDRSGDDPDQLIQAMSILSDALEAYRKDGQESFWVYMNRFLAFCYAYWGLFLDDHIAAKRRYNPLRPHKHGKTF